MWHNTKHKLGAQWLIRYNIEPEVGGSIPAPPSIFWWASSFFLKWAMNAKKNCGSVGESNCGHQQSKLVSQPLRYPCKLVLLCFPYYSSQSLRLDYLITFSNSYGSQICTEAYVDHNNNISCYKFFGYKFRVQMWWQFLSNIKCLT